MRMSPQEFLDCDSRRITLLGMSGVGKTTLSNYLPKEKWFHFSGDYRIGTKYLEEPILDNIKQQAMDIPFLRDLLRSDSIYICNNITVNNLNPVSSFLGKIESNFKSVMANFSSHRQPSRENPVRISRGNCLRHRSRNRIPRRCFHSAAASTKKAVETPSARIHQARSYPDP